MSTERRGRHFGILPPGGTGHLVPFLALAEELRQRGHRITFFERPKIKDRIRQAGFDFVPISHTSPIETEQITTPRRSGLLAEIETLRSRLIRFKEDIELYLRESPQLLRRYEVDALIIDEIALTGPTVAQTLGLPYFVISTSLPHTFGWKGSSWISGYRYSATWLSWLQGVFLELSTLRVRGPVRRLIDRNRKRIGFGPVRNILLEYPPLAHITQVPQCLDRARAQLPDYFFYAGPFATAKARPYVQFPWDKLNGRPVVYASLGTTRSVQAFVFRQIAIACKDLDVQLVLSLGNRFEPEEFGDLPGRPLVVKYAPQLEILKIARVVITHGGANSVFETLLEGKPMIVIPLAYDQPATGARLAQLHLAEVLPVMRLSSERIRTAVTTVLREQSYWDAAALMKQMMSPPRGGTNAAEIIEKFFNRYKSSQMFDPVAEEIEPYSNCCFG